MFKDYPQNKIKAKLQQINEFEEKYGACTTSTGWRKWCTDVNYRKREWEFRQSVAKSIKPNVDYRNV